MAAVRHSQEVAVRAANPDEGRAIAGLWRELWDAHSQPLLALSWQRGLAKRLQLQAAADSAPKSAVSICAGWETTHSPRSIVHGWIISCCCFAARN